MLHRVIGDIANMMIGILPEEQCDIQYLKIVYIDVREYYIYLIKFNEEKEH